MDNPKILLVTIYDPIGNYGNALQNYALYKVLSNLGFEVERLRCPIVEIEINKNTRITRIKNLLLRNIKRPAKLLLALAGVKKYREGLRKRLAPTPEELEQSRIKALERDERIRKDQTRKKAFEDFYTELAGDEINYSSYSEILRSNPSVWEKYKYITAGSDQIWNKVIVGTANALKVYYLSFARREQRVNYASSFGLISIPEEDRALHKEGLEGFERLSCREQAGCNIIKNLTGREAKLVLDPTLLLDSEGWRSISRKPDYEVPEHYALAYFFENNKAYWDVIRHTTGDLEVINLFDPDDFLLYTTGPREFVWLIDHADYVFTNSFHGTAFAINFAKNFITFGKDSKGWYRHVFSRIDTLLSGLGLNDRSYEIGGEIPAREVNYQEVRAKLSALREDSMQYLIECLNVQKTSLCYNNAILRRRDLTKCLKPIKLTRPDQTRLAA